MDGACARCGQNIPPWLTFSVGSDGHAYCSEYCLRLQEQTHRDAHDGRGLLARLTGRDRRE